MMILTCCDDDYFCLMKIDRVLKNGVGVNLLIGLGQIYFNP
jgi:hypothetical protein